jgi:hypothetical protein
MFCVLTLQYFADSLIELCIPLSLIANDDTWKIWKTCSAFELIQHFASVESGSYLQVLQACIKFSLFMFEKFDQNPKTIIIPPLRKRSCR